MTSAEGRKLAAVLPYNPETYYELAWDVRRRMIEEWCAEPGTHPLRVLRRMERHEARNILALETSTTDGVEYLTGGHFWSPRFKDPSALLPTGIPPFVEVALRDRLMMVPSYAEYAGAPARWIADHLANNAYDAIVELGCGLGRNIFAIYDNGGPAGPYYACEFTASGRAATDRLASLVPNMQVSVHPIDHKAPDLSFLKGVKKALIFSVHSIEQVKQIPADYFDTLADAADDVTGMHFEPFGFQLGASHAVAQTQRAGFIKKGWNQNLLERLRDADKRRVIKLTFLSENLFSNTAENPTSVAIWQAKRGG